jgi:hypothetical protein
MISKSVSHTTTFAMNRPVQTVFPLFTPEGEKLWAPGWDYDNLIGTNPLDEDYLFLTRSHNHAAKEAIWIVKKYSPDTFRVQYYKIEPGEKVGIVEVACAPLPCASTEVQVTYRYVGLSETGNRFVERFTKKDYEAFIEEWKRRIEAYFAKTLRPSVPSGH